jgi:hypothetical protein
MTQQKCTNYGATSACISGYCGGPNKDIMYCANNEKMIAADNAANSASNLGTGNVVLDTSDTTDTTSRCDYCANGNSVDTSCIFTNNNVVGRIIKGFSCSCAGTDANLLKNYKFVPDRLT